MNQRPTTYTSLIAVALAMVLLAMPSSLLANDDHDVQVYPRNSTPFGMTYGDWSAASWQWLFSLPVSSIPGLGGGDCLVGQKSGPMFFAPASFGEPLTISCTIPASKAIFIVLLSPECSTLEPPPFAGSNPQELRECAGGFADGTDLNSLELTVDGKPVRNLRRFRTQTPYFDFVMPASDNILGQPGVTAGSSVADGYVVILKPLPVGAM